MSTPRSRLVAEVARSQPIRLTELALAVGIAQGTASTLVDALVRDGLLARRTSAGDRRSVLLRVTAQGAALAQDWTAGYARVAEELFKPLTSQQMSTLVDILRALSAGETSAAGDRRAAHSHHGDRPRLGEWSETNPRIRSAQLPCRAAEQDRGEPGDRVPRRQAHPVRLFSRHTSTGNRRLVRRSCPERGARVRTRSANRHQVVTE
ncbi:MarR family winged helix-turn-helix transcriptional regulator [Saccharothrix carnea]|uniref:MarR family winged helix-turn-helix transcriptional regulator n=1 Tax=Saccharothrix TaxID=2071 RepID=UPI00362C65B9